MFAARHVRKDYGVKRAMWWYRNAVKTPQQFEIKVKSLLSRADSKTGFIQCVSVLLRKFVRKIIDVRKMLIFCDAATILFGKILQSGVKSDTEFVTFRIGCPLSVQFSPLGRPHQRYSESYVRNKVFFIRIHMSNKYSLPQPVIRKYF